MSSQYERKAEARLKTGSYKAGDETKFSYTTFGIVAEVTSAGGKTWKQLEVPVLMLCPRLVAQMRGAGTLGPTDDKVTMFLNTIERKAKPAATAGTAAAPPPAADGGPFGGDGEDDEIPF